MNSGKCYQNSAANGVLYPGECSVCLPQYDGIVVWGGDNGSGFSKVYAPVEFLGFEINYVSFCGYLVTMAVICKAITFITFGAFADYGSARKLMLLGSAAAGALCTILFVLCTSEDYYTFAAVLTVLANVFFGLATVCYNAYIPALTAAHPKLCLAPKNPTKEEADELEKFQDEHESKVSMNSFLYGYSGALVIMIICLGSAVGLFPEPKRENGWSSLRLGIVFTGCVWMLSTLPLAIWVKPRPGPPLPQESSSKCRQFLTNISFGWIQLYRSVKMCLRYKTLLLFFILFFFFMDGVLTCQYMGIIFAQNELCMDMKELALVATIMMIFNILGGVFFIHAKRWFSLSSKTIIMICLGVYSCISIYACIGIVSPDIGLRSKIEAYIFAMIMGIVNGTIQSTARVMCIDLIPLGYEAALLSIYAIVGEGAAALGPTVVGFVFDSGIENRWVFLFLFAEFLIPLICMYFFLDHRKGMIDSGRLRLSDEEKTREKKEEMTKDV